MKDAEYKTGALEDGKSPEILFVDDEAPVRRAFARMLRRKGIAVDVASSGEEALRMAETRGYRLVISDLHMPGLDGINLLGRLHQSHPESKFMLLTGAEETEISLAQPSARFISRILHKPWNTNDLLTLIRASVTLPQQNQEGDGDPGNATQEAMSKTEGSWKVRTLGGDQDRLTSAFSKAYFRRTVDSLLKQRHQDNGNLGVLLVDLNRFSELNDTLGYNVGDELLVGVTQRLQNIMRKGQWLTRIANDQFAITVERIDATMDITRLAKRAIHELTHPVQVEGREVFVGANIGIAVYPTSNGDAMAILRDAESALLQAKEAGRNRYRIFMPEMNRRSAQRIALESELGHALEHEEFEVFYQPILDINTGEVAAAEALLRWRHPERGLIPPGKFIPQLEEIGLIVAVGDWVLRNVAEQIAQWQSTELSNVRVAVNIAAMQFQEEDMHRAVKSVLADTGIPPAMLKLEITESALLEDSAATRTSLQTIRNMGVGISLDDFGTGYSSLSYLRRYPIDTLKIDRSFVNDMTADHEGAAIAAAVVALGKALDLDVIAEGVENSEQLRSLRDLGCNYYQGFIESPPLPADRFVEWVIASRRINSAA